MRCLSSKVSTVGIFFAATALLIIYLLSIRWHIYLPVGLFWVAIGLMIGTIVYQSLKFKLSPGYAKVVLLEIAIICVAFHLIYQIPYYGLRGSDAYMDMASAKGILSSGFIMGDPQYIGGTSSWPMIHILGCQLSLITGIELFNVVKWFSSFIGVALILLLYLLVRSIFREEKAALLSALLFACLQHYILFGSLFIRETIALVLMISCLYLYFSARSSEHRAAYYTLSIMCLVGITLAHHFTALVLFIFLLVHFLVTRASKLSALRKSLFGNGIIGEKVSIVFLLLVLLLPLVYSISGGIQPPAISTPGGVEPGGVEPGGVEPGVISPDGATMPLRILGRFIGSFVTPGKWGTGYADIAGISSGSILTVRGYIIFLGFWFFIVIFGGILLHRLLSKVKNSRLETYSFTLFLFACGVVGFLGLYFIPITIFPSRLLTFGFLFGFPPLVIAILHFNRIWFRRIGIGLLIAFMLFNIYWIEPTAWNARAEGVPAAPSQEDYALANRFDFSNVTIATHPSVMMAIYDVHNNRGANAYTLGNIDLSKFDYVIMHKEALRFELKYYPEPRTQTIAEMEQLMEEGSSDWIKVYESSNLALAAFKKSGTIFDRIEEIGGYEGTNPVIPCGSLVDWDEHIREIGNVLYDPDDIGKEYKTFYSGYQGDYANNQVYVGYAYSSDGKSWTKYGKIISRALEDPFVLKIDDTYYLYAEGKADVPFKNIRRYHSSDCESWNDDGVVLRPSASGWESQDVSSPIVWKEGDTWYMLYEGKGSSPYQGGSWGLATSSDGINWNRDSSNPVFAGSRQEGDWDKQNVGPDDIVKIGSTYYLSYHGYAGSSWQSGIAHSTNLTSWARDDAPVNPSSTVMFYFDGNEYIAHYCLDDSSGIYRGYPIRG